MLKLDHVVFPVADAGKTLAFYRDVLGLPLAATHAGDDWDGYRWLMMVFALAGGQQIVAVALDGAPAPDDGGVARDARHYAMSVAAPAELAAWRTRLTRHGIEFREENHGEQDSIYFADPDGVVLEITSPPSAAMQDAAEALAAVEHWLGRTKEPA